MLKWAGFARAAGAAPSDARGAARDTFAPEPLWLEWTALGGLLLFATAGVAGAGEVGLFE